MNGGELRPFARSMSPLSPDTSRRPLVESQDHDSDLELDEDELDSFLVAHDESPQRRARVRLFAAFLAFGLLNNVLYVIILSAALDLVPASTPKGIVALFNILPALLTKVFWPLISTGHIRYARRVLFCTACSWLGIVIIALSSGLYARLFGISLASLSSGLGELTFLQLTTTLPTSSTSRIALGAWSSGTGAAGIVGAGIWWLLRGLGVKGGLGLSSILPLFFPLTYFVLLPPFASLAIATAGSASYAPLPTDAGIAPSAVDPTSVTLSLGLEHEERDKPIEIHLTTEEKLALVKPLVLRFMLPLFAVYVEEYVINSGVAPTLTFPLPTYGLWSRLFFSPRDYYPFWSLVYQSFVFISRSSLSLGLPPIPRRYLAVPSIIQFVVLVLLSLQSARFIFSAPEYTPPAIPPSTGVDRSITFVFLLICLEGLCGGSSYVNTFYHVGHLGEEGGHHGEQGARRKTEKEFRIGAVGAADSCGILFASLISMPTEVALCNAQIAAGRTTCREL
ncbi:protein BTN1 [Papiliotrema laurentii]|uniref:Protein BTN n=1 Tax=Papiliotrema laurentii TaxID=5418 RepID=A0AAD9FMZ1_PAPLA|nr:protein BTN1 [Papiliotrema laurentii]